MASITAADTYITPEAYLISERSAKYKNEYIHGEALPMSGASNTHNVITMDIATELNIQSRGRKCEVYASTMRVLSGPPN